MWVGVCVCVCVIDMCNDVCDACGDRQQLEMESAVNSVGSAFTDDQVNELTLAHFEHLQVLWLVYLHHLK